MCKEGYLLVGGNPLLKGNWGCVCVCVIFFQFFKGGEFIIYCRLKLLCKYIYLMMICSLTAQVSKCINVRCITVLVLILQRINDNTKNVTCIFHSALN